MGAIRTCVGPSGRWVLSTCGVYPQVDIAARHGDRRIPTVEDVDNDRTLPSPHGEYDPGAPPGTGRRADMVTTLLDRAMRRPAERTTAAARRRLDALGGPARHGGEPEPPLARSYTDPLYAPPLPPSAWPTTPIPVVPEAPPRPYGRGRGGPATRLLAAARDRLPAVLRGRWSLDRRAGIALAMVAAAGVLWAGWQVWQAQPHATTLPAAPRSAAGGWSSRALHDAAAVAPADVAGSTRPALTAGSPDAAGWGAAFPGTAPAGDQSPAADGSGSGAGGALVVDVAGAVKQPGVHRLPPGSRVADAIDASGGALAGTDLSPLNLARRLTDGEQIRVGLPATAPPPESDAPATGGRGRGKKGAASGGAPVSLSHATADQLQTLPGIGPALAQRILDWRTQHGTFTSPDDLQQVPGIGPRKFAQLRGLVAP